MSDKTPPLPPDPEMIAAAMAAAQAAHDLTRGHDALASAARRASLAELVSTAGVNDLTQGADMLAASEEISTMSAAVQSLNEEDLQGVVEIGAIAGELAVLADVLAIMELATMAGFLRGRSQRLHQLAVDNVLRYSAMRALSESMDETGAAVEALGEEEVAEGEARLDLAEAAAANSQALAEAGRGMIEDGLYLLAVSGTEDLLDDGEEEAE